MCVFVEANVWRVVAYLSRHAQVVPLDLLEGDTVVDDGGEDASEAPVHHGVPRLLEGAQDECDLGQHGPGLGVGGVERLEQRQELHDHVRPHLYTESSRQLHDQAVDLLFRAEVLHGQQEGAYIRVEAVRERVDTSCLDVRLLREASVHAWHGGGEVAEYALLLAHLRRQGRQGQQAALGSKVRREGDREGSPRTCLLRDVVYWLSM